MFARPPLLRSEWRPTGGAGGLDAGREQAAGLSEVGEWHRLGRAALTSLHEWVLRNGAEGQLNAQHGSPAGSGRRVLSLFLSPHRLCQIPPNRPITVVKVAQYSSLRRSQP